MSIQIELNHTPSVPQWVTLTPLVVQNKENGEQKIVIMSPNDVLYFNASNGGIYQSNHDWLKRNYTLIRYLSEGDVLKIEG